MHRVKKLSKNVFEKVFALCFALLFCADTLAQLKGKNLVPNPGFEVYKGKNPKPVITSAKPWVNVGTVDFYNKTDEKDTSAFKGPHSGKSYAGIRFQSKYKEYTYVKLTEPLKKGRVYFFSMYVRLLDISTVTVKQLGVYFSDSPFKMGMVFSKDGLIDSTYKGGLSGGFGWFPITGKYKAHGGEKFLIIGNFTTKTKEDFVKRNKWDIFELKEAYYYLDDVSLIDTTSFHVEPVTKIQEKEETHVHIDTVIVHKVVEIKTVYFENASNKLQKQSLLVIDQIVALLQSNPTMEVEIKGHADNQGTEIVNKQLSQERAEAVYEYLKKRGVTTPMTYEGYGSSQPVAPNDTSENRAKNRRVEVYLTKTF